MAYLTEKEKSILFSAITREEKVCKEHGFDDLVKVCQRLLHVFSYNRLEKHIRNKTIDEFVNRLEKHQQENWVDNLEYGITWSDIEEIIKQMKEG